VGINGDRTEGSKEKAATLHGVAQGTESEVVPPHSISAYMLHILWKRECFPVGLPMVKALIEMGVFGQLISCLLAIVRMLPLTDPQG
jgi:hypothetical protein